MKKFIFSLIELLIVITIILILISLIQPALQKTLQQAKIVECLTNIKQVGIGWETQAEDNSYISFEYMGEGKIWQDHLKDYISVKAFQCPETEAVAEGELLLGPADLMWREPRKNTEAPYDTGSYGFNIAVSRVDNYYNNVCYSRLNDIDNPSQTPVVGDAFWRSPARIQNHLVRRIPTDLSNPYSSTQNMNDLMHDGGQWNGSTLHRFIHNRHGETSNLVFADGHVAPLQFEEVYRQQWTSVYDPTLPVLY